MKIKLGIVFSLLALTVRAQPPPVAGQAPTGAAGAGGDEDAWNNMGRASVIMDNLIAAGKAKPMLVVMTNGNANQTMGPGYGVVPGQNVVNTENPGEADVVGALPADAAVQRDSAGAVHVEDPAADRAAALAERLSPKA